MTGARPWRALRLARGSATPPQRGRAVVTKIDSRTAKRPELRAVALKAIINSEVTWVTHYERQWVNKAYGIMRRVPVLGRRAILRPAPVDVLIRQGAADRSPLVRRVAAHGLVRHAASLSNIKSLMTLFDSDRSPSVRWNIEYLARTINSS